MSKLLIKSAFDKISTIKNYQDLFHKVKNYEYVSFDIFDTLIKRDVPQPTDLFEVLGYKENISNYQQQRIFAEKKASVKNKNHTSLADIYDNLSYLPNYHQLKKDECQEEIRLSHVNFDILSFYKYCLTNKKVILITDMYLDRLTIENILKKNHLLGYYKLFISNEINEMKSSGNLFRYALKSLNINSNQIVHIGNDWRADYWGAKKVKINSIKIPTYKNRKEREYQDLFDRHAQDFKFLMAFVNNHTPETDNSYLKSGYEVVGPILYGFTRWLFNQARHQGLKQILFMSREGYLLKKAYDLLNFNREIPSLYLEVSRRSLSVPTFILRPSLPSIIESLANNARVTTIGKVMEQLGLEADGYTNQLSKYHLSLTKIWNWNNLKKNQEFIQFCSAIQEDIFTNSQKEFSALRQYLKTIDFSLPTALVDIGWGGNMQNFLVNILNSLGIKNELYGYYVGLERRSVKILGTNNLTAAGYVFDCLSHNDDQDLIIKFIGLCETLFLEPAGSVKKYKLVAGQKVIVERYPYEYSGNQQKKQSQFIQSVQEGALKFVSEFNNSSIVDYINLDSKTMFAPLYQLGTQPTLKEARRFGDFEFFDAGKVSFLAKPRSLLWYLGHLKILADDVNTSVWKVGYLKRFFKLNLNYARLYDYLYDIYQKFKKYKH